MTPPCSGGRSSNVGLVWIGEQRLERGEDALPRRDPVGQRAVEFDDAVARHDRGGRIAADEREPRPPLGALHRFEQESRAVADELHVGRDRRLEIGEHRRPHGHDRVRGRVRVEVLAGRKELHRQPKARKKQVRAPVWQAPAPSCSTLNSNVSPSQS